MVSQTLESKAQVIRNDSFREITVHAPFDWVYLSDADEAIEKGYTPCHKPQDRVVSKWERTELYRDIVKVTLDGVGAPQGIDAFTASEVRSDYGSKCIYLFSFQFYKKK